MGYNFDNIMRFHSCIFCRTGKSCTADTADLIGSVISEKMYTCIELALTARPFAVNFEPFEPKFREPRETRGFGIFLEQFEPTIRAAWSLGLWGPV